MCFSNKAIISVVNFLNSGNDVVSIQTTCHAGTHRSVATAEFIARELRGEG